MLAWFLLALQQPIVVDVGKQPTPTPAITVGDVFLSTFGLIGLIVLMATICGAIVAGIVILRKRQADAVAPRHGQDHEHITLRIGETRPDRRT